MSTRDPESESLSIVFGLGRLTPTAALDVIEAVYRKHGFSLDEFSRREKPLRFASLVATIKRSGRKTFSIWSDRYDIQLAHVTNDHHNLLVVDTHARPNVPWSDWIAQVAGSEHFVMAWVTNIEYETWQNMWDPQFYVLAGKPFDHLPKVLSESPSLRGQLVVDCSENPGRRVIRDGYVEAIGATMWLGAPFWELTGADLSEVVVADWLRINWPLPNVLALEAAPTPFISADGISGELQGQLRHLLFPSSRHRPKHVN
jgi:hypothetical protein